MCDFFIVLKHKSSKTTPKSEIVVINRNAFFNYNDDDDAEAVVTVAVVTLAGVACVNCATTTPDDATSVEDGAVVAVGPEDSVPTCACEINIL